MKNDVLDAEKPMLMLADYLEALNAYLDSPAYSGVLEQVMNDADNALHELDPARIRQLGTLLAQLRPLAVTASSSTGTASEVRKARDELVRVCLELGGEG